MTSRKGYRKLTTRSCRSEKKTHQKIGIVSSNEKQESRLSAWLLATESNRQVIGHNTWPRSCMTSAHASERPATLPAAFKWLIGTFYIQCRSSIWIRNQLESGISLNSDAMKNICCGLRKNHGIRNHEVRLGDPINKVLFIFSPPPTPSRSVGQSMVNVQLEAWKSKSTYHTYLLLYPSRLALGGYQQPHGALTVNDRDFPTINLQGHGSCHGRRKMYFFCFCFPLTNFGILLPL